MGKFSDMPTYPIPEVGYKRNLCIQLRNPAWHFHPFILQSIHGQYPWILVAKLFSPQGMAWLGIPYKPGGSTEDYPTRIKPNDQLSRLAAFF